MRRVHLRRKVKVFLALFHAIFYIFFTFLRNINILLVSSLLGLLCTLARTSLVLMVHGRQVLIFFR